jgi:hypothetical protein
MLEDATVSIDSMRVMLVWILLLLLLAFFLRTELCNSRKHYLEL